MELNYSLQSTVEYDVDLSAGSNNNQINYIIFKQHTTVTHGNGKVDGDMCDRRSH
jgi:hypothetical protein